MELKFGIGGTSESVLFYRKRLFSIVQKTSQDLIKGARIKLKEKSDVKVSR